jgi:hypothetical protein
MSKVTDVRNKNVIENLKNDHQHTEEELAENLTREAF